MITICNQISVLEIQMKLKCIKNNRTKKDYDKKNDLNWLI